MADDSQFVPDDMDFPDDVDPDAYLEMEQEWDAEMRDHENNMHMAGQGNPRKLDFAAFGDRSATFSDPMQPPLSQAGTAAVSSQLQLRLDTASQLPTLSNFEREQREEAEQQQKQQQLQQRGQSAVALPPQQTASRLFPSPAVLPPLLRSVSELRQRVLDDERMYVYRRAPVLGEFMPVTTVKGDRVFLTMSTQDEAAKKLSAHSHLQRTAQMQRDLGQVNVRRLIRQLDEEATAASIQASLDEAKAREWDSDPEDDEKTKLRKRRQRKERLIEKLDRQDQSLAAAGRNRHLWVDKYAPKGYADLLSPEHINREVLEWLKSWDTCVFGNRKGPDLPSGPAGATRTIDNHMLSNGMLSPAGRRKPKPVQLVSADGENDIRPEHKVILLCGPPGLGKTTLAHILARQAGYNPYEINASDDRNAGVLESKIRAATEMQSVSFGAAHVARPNCVILDEIDGVAGEQGGQGAIQSLLRIIQAEARQAKAGKNRKTDAKEDAPDDEDGSDADAEEGGEDAPAATARKSKRAAASADGVPKKSRPGPLRRPIICICNDQFAAALRPLRAIARIFEFTAAPKGKFVDRLKSVARNEGMDVDARTLGALADIVDCDIRSALNTLQFVHSKGQKLTAAALNSLAVGRKDVERSRRQVWDAVFCDKESKKDNLLHFKDMRETDAVNNRSVASSVVNAKESKSRELLGLLSDSGDLDKVMEGVYHNYPSVGYPDPNLHKTVECAEWMAFADLMERRMQSEVDASMHQYTPYAALAVHQLTSRPRRVKIETPSMFYHQYVEMMRNQNILRSFLSPSNCFTLEGATLTSTVLDVVPHVLDILHPTIRAVNFALLTSKEKAELHNLIDTMLSLSISYRPEVQSAFASSSMPAWKQGAGAGAEGSNVVYKLEPSIDLLSEWSHPLDAATTKKFEAKDKWGNPFEKKTFVKFGQPPPPVAQASFHIDKRDVHMPNKVKREVLRELEFESMRRAEAARTARFSEEAQATLHGRADAEAAAHGVAAPSADPAQASFLSPAVQRMLDEEKRKRERPAEAATPPTGASKLAVGADDGISPATKRAKHSAALNFLNQHADAARNSKARQRGRAPAASKLELGGLQTERESKMSDVSASAGGSSGSGSGSMGPPAAVPARLLHPLHFKYNEGCTNAVRRTIHVAHFLPL